MPFLRRRMRNFQSPLRTSTLLAAASLFILAGCAKTQKVSDPQLKPIQDMLETNLPPRAPQGTVSQFLAERRFPTQPSSKPGTIVAIIRHRDGEKSQPITALVTFYFDANGMLNTYEIIRTTNGPAPQ
jgi:hypothetical protein